MVGALIYRAVRSRSGTVLSPNFGWDADLAGLAWLCAWICRPSRFSAGASKKGQAHRTDGPALHL